MNELRASDGSKKGALPYDKVNNTYTVFPLRAVLDMLKHFIRIFCRFSGYTLQSGILPK